MVTYDEYFKDILKQVLDSHQRLSGLEDKPGDLDVISKEIVKIMALFQIIVSKIEGSNSSRPSHEELASVAEKYIDTYSFEHEIRRMTPLYSEDTNRIHNIRFKILESFADGKLINKINHIIEDLQ